MRLFHCKAAGNKNSLEVTGKYNEACTRLMRLSAHGEPARIGKARFVECLFSGIYKRFLCNFFSRAYKAYLIAGALFCIFSQLFAQQPVVMEWPLTGMHQVVKPNSFSSLGFNIGKSVDSLQFTEEFGATTTGWNTDNLDPGAYYEYTITPAPGRSIEITRLNFEVSLSRVNMRTSVQYSYDGFRMQKTQIGHTIYIATHEPRNLPVKTSLRVTYPQTLSIRIYGWSTIDYQVDFCNRNVTFEGVVFGKDLLAKNEIDNQDISPESLVVDPLAKNALNQLPQTDTTIATEPLVAMAVMPPGDTVVGSGNLVKGVMGSVPFTSSQTWTVPANVYEITVECWGGGGGGGGTYTPGNNDGGGGGGGGGFRGGVISVSPGDIITIVVGAGGSGAGNNNTGGNGGNSSVSHTNGTITAFGGTGGGCSDNGGVGGNGGDGSFSGVISNQISWSGGTGGTGNTDNGGGGGGGAGNAQNGGSGSGITGGAGGNTLGGAGGNGSSNDNPGGNGQIIGGAGGGASDNNASVGGNGFRGQVIITWDDIPDYRAEFISMDFGSNNWCAGETRTVSVTVKNTGLATWTDVSPDVNIGVKWNTNGASWADYYVRTNANNLAPGETATYSLTIAASNFINGTGYTTPLATGINNLTFDVVKEGDCWFGNNNGSCGPGNSVFTSSNISIIDIPAQPSSISGPLSPCVGSSQTYSVTNVPGTTYTWTFPTGWTQTGGGTSNSVTVTVGATGGTITVTPSNSCGTGTARTLAVTTTTVPAQPSAITGNDNPCQGTSQTYSVTSVAGVTYNWVFPGGWTQTGGGTTNSVTVTVGINNGNITVTPSNSCGNGTARTLGVTVDPLPTPPTAITSSANPVCVNAGGNITLTATGGSGTTLRWFTGSCGGTAIGTGNPFVIASPVATTTYYARWENDCGNSTCASITVNVTPLPAPPTNATVNRTNFCADDSGNITLTASGGSGATLEWYSGSCGGTLEGTGTSLTIASPTATTNYYARWANDCGVSTCVSVTVTVLPLPVAPTYASVDRDGLCYDDDGNIILTATGGSGDELQWFTGSCGGSLIGVGNDLSIASPTLTTTYYVRWNSATCGASTCTSVTVTVNNVTAGAIAADQTICHGGDPALLTSTTPGTGMGNITYRWESAVSPFTVWNPIAGATGSTYNPPGGLTETTYFRRITVSDYNGGCESEPTAAVRVAVQSVPDPGEIAEDQYICFGGSTAPLYSVVDGTGDGTITYRWERSVTPFTVWTTIAGATGAGYNPGPLAFTTQFRRFTVSTLNGIACESAASNITTITIQDVAVTSGSIGNNQTICYNETPDNLVSVVDGTASAGATVSYEWQINTGAWTLIPGENNAGLNISTPHTVTTSYRRRTVATLAGNSCYSDWTLQVTITVIRPVTAGSIAASQTICNGETPAALTSVTAGASPGATITYRWEQSTDLGATWTTIGGATTATYAPGTLTQTTWYRRITIATQNGTSCESVPTNTVIITVQDVVNPGSIAASQTICYGATPAPLTSAAPGSGSSSPAYSWEYSTNGGATWIPIAGANGAGYAPGALTQTTWFRRITTCTVNGVNCSAASAHVVITVQGQVIPPAATADQTICYNTTPALLNRTNASGGSGSFTYQWQSSTDNVNFINVGASGMTFQPPALTVTTYYRVAVTDASCGGPFYSNVVTITVRPELVAPFICCDQILCLGSQPDPLTGVPATGGSNNFSYQWQWSADGNPPWNNTGATNPLMYTPPAQSRFYRLVATDFCGTVISNTIEISTGLDFGGTISLSGYPSSAVCPGYNFTAHIESASIGGLFGRVIRYSWTADPAYVSPPTGGPVGITSYWWIFPYFEADIPFTVFNTTNLPVTTTVSIVPGVYNNPGPPPSGFVCNLSPRTFNVTINPFMLVCPSDITANTSAGSCTAQINIPNIQWVPNSCTSTVTWTMSGATTGTNTGNMGTRTFNQGVTTVTYSSVLNGQTTTCSFTVTVTDTEAPAISCPANITRNTDLNQCAASIATPNPIFSDNCGGAAGVTLLTWSMSGATTGTSPMTGINYVGTQTFNPGVTTINYSAEDAAGNKNTCSYTVTVTDNQSPTFTSCPSNYNVSTDEDVCSATFDPADPVVTDNCYDLLAVTWEMTGATTGSSPMTGINFLGNTTFNTGTTTITYTAVDPGGNNASCEFTVTVTDNEAPAFTFCPPGYSENAEPGRCDAEINTQNPEYYDNCGISGLTWTITGATNGSGSGNIGQYTFNVGTSIVVYTLADNSTPPLTATCTYEVRVIDNQSPTMDCPANQNRVTDPGVCTYTTIGTEFDPVNINENCTTYTLSNDFTGGPTLAGAAFPQGTTTVRWVLIDAGGNTT